MAPTRRQVLQGVGTAGAFTIAGCSSDGGGEETSTTTETTTTEPMTGQETVQVATHDDLGDILVDGEGMTLYMFDQDSKGSGASSCYDNCAASWPPLTVDGSPTAASDVTASLSTFQRDDGATQVAASGWPLYYFSPDQTPGDASGQGVQGVWWVLGADGTPKRDTDTTTTTTAEMDVDVRSHDDHGDILVDGEGMTLYMFDQDTQGSNASSCTGDCASAWPPHTVEGSPSAADGVTAELSTFERSDGATQIAANGWPLYGYAQDQNPGDAAGQGVIDAWWVLAPDGTPQRTTNDTTTTTEDDGGLY